jgi:meso-butanediol dehydrogenase/(S,S)-butanediol dehydrogenase/diacetyl reductase
MPFPELENKVVLITGAGRGIGKAIAQSFSEEKSIVVVTDINEKEAAEVSEEFRKKGRKTSFAHLDVTNRSEAERLTKNVENQWGPIDILVNNAGVSTMHRVVDLTDEEWDYNMNVNAKGVFIMSQLVVRSMINHKIKGKIINTASMAGKKGAMFLAHYSTSKFGVVGFTQALALEVAQYGINVNAVCPGYVKTSMQEREIPWESKLRGITEEEMVQLFLNDTPLGRIEEPQDVANVVLFLASHLSDFMTGQAINVTGGACRH